MFSGAGIGDPDADEYDAQTRTEIEYIRDFICCRPTRLRGAIPQG
jgi:hypothetical protein